MVKLSLCLTKHCALKTYGEVDVQSQIFLISALGGDEWSASCPGGFNQAYEPPVPNVQEAGWAQSRSERCGT
jgi:hypothetical protein